VSDNLCLRQEGVVFLDFWEFHGVLGFGNYGEVEMRSKADDADDAKEAIGEGFFRGSRVRIARAAMSCRPRPVKFSTNSVCRSQNGSLMGAITAEGIIFRDSEFLRPRLVSPI